MSKRIKVVWKATGQVARSFNSIVTFAEWYDTQDSSGVFGKPLPVDARDVKIEMRPEDWESLRYLQGCFEKRRRQKEIEKAIRNLKRESRLTLQGGRKVKAWRVPGTQEHGRLAMLKKQLED